MFRVEYQAKPGLWLSLPTEPLPTHEGAVAVAGRQLALERCFPTISRYDYRVVDRDGILIGLVTEVSTPDGEESCAP